MDYEDLPPDYKKTFSRYTNLLKFMGIDVFNSSGISVQSMKRLFVFSLVSLPLACSQFSLMGKISADNFLESVKCVPICVFSMLGIIKIIIALMKKWEIKQMFLEIGELWPRGLVDGDDKAVIMTNWMRRVGILPNGWVVSLVPKDTAMSFITLWRHCGTYALGAGAAPTKFTRLTRKCVQWCVRSGAHTYKPRDVPLYEDDILGCYYYDLISWLRLPTLDNESIKKIAFYLYSVVAMVGFETMALVTTIYNILSGVDEYVLPMQMIDLWAVDSTASYAATFVWQVVGSMPHQLCLYIPYDIMIMKLISNVSVLLRLLQVDLQNAIESRHHGIRRQDMSYSDSSTYERIVRIVKDHQKLLRISDQISNIFGLVTVIHIALSAIVICFFGFQAVATSGLAETISNVLAGLFGVIAIFLLALSGQLLCDTSSGVADAAYHSLWFDSDKKVKKLILFIIIRSQKCCFLSALGFSNMTLQSFSKIMSTAYTYFSLLVQMYKKE